MKLAFYLRLSLADGDLGKNNKDESNSIENQRLILQNFPKSLRGSRAARKSYFSSAWDARKTRSGMTA